jgi:MFS family permease
MLDESISQQSGNDINKLCPCFSGAYWFDAVNKIQLLSNMANVLSILFISVFARFFGTSYFEVGLIVSVYSTATLISSFIFGRFTDYYHPRTMLLRGFGFSVAAFILQVFASNPAL